MAKDTRKRTSFKGPQRAAAAKQSLKKKQKTRSKQSLAETREALDSQAQEIYAVRAALKMLHDQDIYSGYFWLDGYS